MTATPPDKIYKAAGLAVLSKRLVVVEYIKMFKLLFDECHPLHDAPEPILRLKSRKGFIASVVIEHPNDYLLLQRFD